MLNEAPEDDVRRSDLAERFIDACVSYLYRAEKPLPTTEFRAQDHPIVTNEMISGPRIFDGLILAFFEDDRSYSGRASSVFGAPGWKYAIFIHVDDISTPKKIMYSLTSPKIRSTLRHEVQHVLDRIRSKKKDKTPPVPSDRTNADDGYDKYFNSPSELNAYFHNVAEPLLERIRFIHKHGLEMDGIFAPIDPDFRTWFSKHIASLYGSHAMFWNHLTDDNKRKVIKRLEKLHSHYFKLNKAIQAKYSEE